MAKPMRLTTLYTAPNGTADVALDVVSRAYVVRFKTERGRWYRLDNSFPVRAMAVRAAKEIDRFKPDGSGRF